MNKSVRFPPQGQFSPLSRWTYALTMPCLTILVGYLLLGDDYWRSGYQFFGTTLLNGALLAGAFLSQNWVAEKITHRYPRPRQTMSRVVLTLLSHSLLSALVFVIIAGLYSQFRFFGITHAYESLLIAYLINLVFIVLSVLIYETFYSLTQWQQHQINKEKLKKENVLGQLQCLKSQVNPHFLFNSLNSLSSLIADEPQRAEQFVDQMARVYRYMLQTNRRADAYFVPDGSKTTDPDDELTTLDAELSFIESYYHLLKTRHGTGLYLDVHVADPYRHYRLPSLTLQLLVENAVKHNVILTSRPLYIEIKTTDDGYLRVRNNLQKKTAPVSRAVLPATGEQESAHVGLANIRAKYALLARTEPSIEAGPDYFTVTLPLFGKSRP